MDERKHLILLKGQNKTKESRFRCQRNGPARLSLPRGESEKDIPGTKQAQRDRLKDSIFEKYGIPLLRLPTNGSGEIEKVRTYLERTK